MPSQRYVSKLPVRKATSKIQKGYGSKLGYPNMDGELLLADLTTKIDETMWFLNVSNLPAPSSLAMASVMRSPQNSYMDLPPHAESSKSRKVRLGIGKQIQSISKLDGKIPDMFRQLPDASGGLQLGSHFKSVWPSKMKTFMRATDPGHRN